MSTTGDRPLLWTPQAFRELQHWQQNINALIDQRVRALLGNTPSFREKDVRFGVTTTQGTDPYPSNNSNTFWVKLGEPLFDEATGNNELEVFPYDPPVLRLAHSLGGFVPEGESVALILSHGRYFMVNNDGGATGWLVRTTSSVGAFNESENQLGMGSGLVYAVDSSGEITLTEEAITLYNSQPTVIPTDTVVQAKNIDGLAFVDVVPCVPEEPAP